MIESVIHLNSSNVDPMKQRSRSIIKAIDQRKYTSQQLISYVSPYATSNDPRGVRKDRRGNSIKLNGGHQIVISDEVDVKEFSKQSEKNSVELMDEIKSPPESIIKVVEKEQISSEQPRTQTLQLNDIQSQLRLGYMNYKNSKLQTNKPEEQQIKISKKTSCSCSIF